MFTPQMVAAALRAAANILDPAGAGFAPLAPAAAQLLAPAATTAATVTEQQLTDLIMPHIGNEAVKTALGEAMRAMGIGSLPETQPHQYAPLYASFQGVLARFGLGGAAPAAASTSII